MKPRHIAILIWLFSAAPGAASHAQALAAERRPPSTIEVTADAEVEVPADVAIVELGVLAQAQSAAAAAQRNAEQMNAVLAALRNIAGEAARVETGTYSLSPDYTHPRDGGAVQVTGYTARNIVRVKTAALERVGAIVDAGIRAGANQVQRLTFALEQPARAQNAALRQAVAAAREKAETTAAALGLQVTGFYTAVAHDVGGVRPLVREAAVARAQSMVPTPVEPGVIQVRARVTLTVRVGS
ncbi:MAG TPA: SIMPL domain-containing protein [Burkholderiales bacterium]|nr:SIMPL domain-containing protein [Burkholderiales bacterium]